ncbi:MAG: NAD(P)/FAD-dependent oxidoreductase [Coriobacteriaceae bacterium]|nr:NAD(P)/FAD-dependent oxidoreductase [Coriobacteriaceae bacterium]
MPAIASYDVAVIGGGASGLAAAITAARAGARTCVIERDVEAGLALLATGNGRCNISNNALRPRHYRHPDVAEELFGAHPEHDIAAFFTSLGLELAQEGEGRLYPITRRAESVRDVLLAACSRLGIDILTCSRVTDARQTGIWELTVSAPASPLAYKRGHDEKARVRNARKALASVALADSRLHAASVVLAVGGHVEEVCRVFLLPHLEERPLLCPIACELTPALDMASHGENTLEYLDGLRVEAMASLVRNGAAIAYEQGEVLFRRYGISGIAAFNLSRRIEAGDTIELDLFPHLNAANLESLLRTREQAIGSFSRSGTWFDGILARRLGELVTRAVSASSDQLATAAGLLHRIPLAVQGTAEPAQAQVRQGGIPFSIIDLDTLSLNPSTASASQAGLFACGEALDMDADCGGFNLAWAWLSGMRAGSYAAAHSRKELHA